MSVNVSWNKFFLSVVICIFSTLFYQVADINGADTSYDYKHPIIIPAIKTHNVSIIFIHDMDENGDDWAHSLARLRKPHMKIICPNANKMPVTNKQITRVMSAWFCKGVHYNDSIDTEMEKACGYIRHLIDNEVNNGIKPENIIVGGFSQGGALALRSALHYSKKLGGIIVLSGWLPESYKYASMQNNIQSGVPMLQCHGSKDSVIPLSYGKATFDVLKHISQKAVFKEHTGADHDASNQGLVDIKEFLNNFP